QRIKDYPVLPRLQMGKIEEFFAELPREDLPVYVGEQYLELHRATLTTQALVKQLNRQSEHRLTEAETFGALAALSGGFPYPYNQLDEGWTTLLLNQFHDVLPGSSIHEVYQDTHPMLRGVIESATALRDVAIAHLAGPSKGAFAVANPDLHERPLTVLLPSDAKPVALDGDALPAQQVDGGQLVHDPDRAVAPLAITGLTTTKKAAKPVRTVSAKAGKKESVLENDLLRVVIGADGTLQSITDKAANREVLAGRANQLWAYIDRPRAWDAWDIDETYEVIGMEITDVDKIEAVEDGPLRAAIRVSRTWRSSTFTQTYRLLAGSRRLDIVNDIDWHERLVLVRALFPVEVHAHEATFETMYGVVRRATHRNTSWEQAKFEASAHRFVDLSEPSYGVALLNDAKYGHSAHGNVLGISLVRGPLHPDPMADEGEHHFTYSLFPHEGDWVAGKVTREARALNSPLVAVSAGNGKSADPFVVNEGLELGLGALKQAHDRKGIVLRVYEPHGDRGVATLRFAKAPKSVRRVNLLEEDVDDGKLEVKKGAVTLDVRPFEVLSLLIES
ncbi:MAG TPA: glycoside hydrolase family 38 C-terminal domain-containing protein, partial [Candidatus Limnocylindria bacterium]|nr:glycoside hydrolase family 38 C-terminal domain-containing protein [Candidatus Limnocylindria bacterium]